MAAEPLMPRFAALRAALSHTRVVESGSFPLYRVLLACSFISSVTQAFDRQATVSVTSITPDWGDWLFIVCQGGASVAILVALYMIDANKDHATRLHDSLSLEFIGLVILQTIIAINVIAVCFYYHRPPTGQGTWFQIGFSFWCSFRLWDIRKAIRTLVHTDSP
ncbi:hypothetical protein [Mycobacterium yunnanensis]|nr:hypothetical protein [Mycobacterium yunnanensis]